jgi:hypothetical protein
MLRQAKRILRRLVSKVPGAPPAPMKGELPDWKRLLAADEPMWREAVRKAAGGPGVLIATYVGGHPQFTALESGLAVALTLRGARVEPLLCDQAFPACLRAKISGIEPAGLARFELPKVFCLDCVEKGDAVFEPLGLNVRRVSRSITSEEAAEARALAAQVPYREVRGWSLNGWPLGEHALAGALRYYGRGDLENEPEGETVVRRYLEASILSARSLHRLLKSAPYRAAVVNHAIYVPQGITAAVCRSEGVRVAAWNLAYRQQCAIFSHDDTYHHTLLAEPASQWDGIPWSKEAERQILSYLESRQKGTRDWIWFNRSPDEDMARFAGSTGLDWKRPVIGMLTNVIWDAQLHYPANAFPNMVDWALRTIGYFQKRPDLQLLIRIHPGELAPPGGVTKSRQPMAAEIQRAFPRLPANIFVIPPESKISTYATMRRCDSVLIYGTKTGVELTSLGIPVVVAGEAWIRNKGLTLDASTAEEYFRHLDRLPLARRMDEEAVGRARRYAYHFFFRRMIPLPFLKPAAGWPPYRVFIDRLADLLPGKHPGLDVLCDGILEGTPFVYPAERFGVHDA